MIARLLGLRRAAPGPEGQSAEERVAVATQLQLTWWRFRKHKLAVISGVVVILFYLVAAFADFLAVADPQDTDSRRSYAPPQAIHFFDDDGAFRPYVVVLRARRDMRTFRMVFDQPSHVYLSFFTRGYSYDLFGLFTTDIHLVGLANPQPGDTLHLLGADRLGRDLWSRLMVATRVSLTIGLVGVVISLFLGILLGGISAIYGGWIDMTIQRIIEIIRSMPILPVWLGLAAALPSDWSVLRVYFAITVIFALL